MMIFMISLDPRRSGSPGHRGRRRPTGSRPRSTVDGCDSARHRSTTRPCSSVQYSLVIVASLPLIGALNVAQERLIDK
jgi:hypothetical protein